MTRTDFGILAVRLHEWKRSHSVPKGSIPRQIIHMLQYDESRLHHHFIPYVERLLVCR